MDLHFDYTMGSCTSFNRFDYLESFPEKIVRIASVRGKICPVGLAASRGCGGLRYDWYVGTVVLFHIICLTTKCIIVRL